MSHGPAPLGYRPGQNSYFNPDYAQPLGVMPIDDNIVQPLGIMPIPDYAQPLGVMPIPDYAQPLGVMPIDDGLVQPLGIMPIDHDYLQPLGIMPVEPYPTYPMPRPLPRSGGLESQFGQFFQLITNFLSLLGQRIGA